MMRAKLSRLMLVVARWLMRSARKVDPSIVANIDAAQRHTAWLGQQAGIAAGGLLETLVQQGKYPSKGVAREKLGINVGLPGLADPLNTWFARLSSGIAGARPELPNVAAPTKGARKFGDWLELNDYGYPLGLLLFTAGGVTALVTGLWWVAVPAMVAASFICWWFG